MQTITLTFGDQAENHKGMNKIGKMSDVGFTPNDLVTSAKEFISHGASCEVYNLNMNLPPDETCDQEAYVLVIRNGVSMIVDEKQLTDEQDALPKDSKAIMYGRVVNKRARHNLCFGPQHVNPDYERGQGTVIGYDEVPILNELRKGLPKWFGSKAENLVIEGNYYYDSKKCGIGLHGDTERKKVIAVRLGAPMPLCFYWYKQCKPISQKMGIMLNSGDMYVMSEKAVGYDWKTRKYPTLRHAAGSIKYTK